MPQFQTFECSHETQIRTGTTFLVSSWFRHDPANGRRIDAQPLAKAIGAALLLDGRADRQRAQTLGLMVKGALARWAGQRV